MSLSSGAPLSQSMSGPRAVAVDLPAHHAWSVDVTPTARCGSNSGMTSGEGPRRLAGAWPNAGMTAQTATMAHSVANPARITRTYTLDPAPLVPRFPDRRLFIGRMPAGRHLWDSPDR